MNPLVRWLRFNLVGAVGVAVQLGALALLNRAVGGHYLVATALALEITLLHNFAWHVGYTWRDRGAPQGLKPGSFGSGLSARLKSCPYAEPLDFSARNPSAGWVPRSCPFASSKALLGPLLRFHLSNGLVSFLGNLALMRLLVEGAHMPVLAANGIAILSCSVVNFLLADRWAFAAAAAGSRPYGTELSS